MAEAGRNTILNDELLRKIKQSILDGNDLKTTASVCGIVESTLYCWSSDNYLKLADKIEGWRRDRKLILANKNIEEILVMDKSDKDKLKVISDMSKFVAETLGKDVYSKRSELTGAEGGPVNITKINYILPNGNNDNTNGETAPSLPGTEQPRED